jgi:hypothetical protein
MAPTKNADGYTFKELYDAVADKETEVKPMTDFNDWYARTPKNHPATRICLEAEMRKAYEAGAASQSETLRDKFAGQAMAGLASINAKEPAGLFASHAYKMADALLEARKVKGEET